MRHGFELVASARRHELLQYIQRKALARPIIVDATKHHRTAQPSAPADDLLARHPKRTLDAVIELPRRVVIAHRAAKREAEKAAITLGLLPEVHSHERLGTKDPSRFFERFSHDGIHRTFAAFHVTRRLVEHHTIAGALLDEQKLAIAFDDRRYG